jgi:hypothetical protein
MPPAPVPENKFGESDLYRVVSHGRGGAGNITEDNSKGEDPMSLPHLTGSVYTTGRGGTGNMAQNDPNHPEYARLAQDVELNFPRPSSSDIHGGRGGAGNVFPPTEEDLKAAKIRAEEEKKAATRPPPVDHSKIDYRGWADKGKDLLFRRSKNDHH